MDLGTLQYNVVADTTGLDNGNAAMDAMAEKAQEAGAAVDGLGESVKKTSQKSAPATKQMQEDFERITAAMNKQIALFGKYGREAELAYETTKGSLAGLSAQQKTALLDQAKQVDQLSQSFRGMRGVAQSAGYQLQDIAVQAQMGTNAFVILGQQGSQFASAFGPTGAVIGAVLAVGAAVGGVLFASFMAASKAVEELEENVKGLIKEYDQLTLAQQGIVDRGVGLVIDDLTKKHKEEQKAIDEKTAAIKRLNEENGKTVISSAVTMGTGGLSATQQETTIDNTKRLSDAERELGALLAQRTVTERQIAELRDPTGAQKQISQLQNEAELIGLTGRAYWELKASQEGVADAYRESWIAANLLLETRKKEQEQSEAILKSFDDEIDARIKAQKAAYDAEEKRAESIAKQIKQMEKQAELFGNQSKYVETLYDIENGIIKVTDAERERLLLAAKGYDAAQAAAQEQKEYIDALKKWVTDQRKAEKEATKQAEKDAKERAKFSEDAAERINGAFASAWVGIMDDADSAFDGIANSFKQLLAEMAHEALTKPIIMNIQQAMTGGGTSAAQGGGGALSAIGGAAGLYAAGAVVAIAAVNAWNKKQDEKFAKMTAEYRQGTQSTGTLLGMANEKSDSIAQSIQNLGDLSGDVLNVNRGMYMSLQSIDAGINGIASGFARQFGVSGYGSMNIKEYSKAGVTRLGDTRLFKELERGAAKLDIIGGDIITGLAGGIMDGINKAVYSKSKKVIDSGIQFAGNTLAQILADGAVDAFAYADIKTTKKILGIKTSTKVKTQQEDLNDVLLGQFADVFSGAGDALEQAADIFGLDFDNYINRLVIDPQKLSLKDLEGDALTKEIESFFSATLDNWAGVLTDGSNVLKEFQQVGEGAFETVIRLASELNTFNSYANALNLNFSLVGFAAVDASQSIAEAAGGFDQLNASLSGYYENFFSDSERASAQMELLSNALKEIGINTVPDSREAFRALIESIDLSTEAGQKQFAGLINLQGVFAELNPLIDEATVSVESLAKDALAKLERSVSAEKELLNSQINLIESSLSVSRSVFGALESSLNGLLISSASTQAATRRQAQSQLQSMLSGARGGILPDINALNNALSTISQPSENLYSTFEEYATDFYRTAATIKELQDITGEQVSAEEKALASLESQVDLLDEMLSWAKLQVDELNGIDNSVVSVADAINELSAIIGVQYQTPEQIKALEQSAAAYRANNESQDKISATIDANAKISQQQTKEFNEFMRASQIAIADSTDKIKKILDKFDAIGMPPERA